MTLHKNVPENCWLQLFTSNNHNNCEQNPQQRFNYLRYHTYNIFSNCILIKYFVCGWVFFFCMFVILRLILWFLCWFWHQSYVLHLFCGFLLLVWTSHILFVIYVNNHISSLCDAAAAFSAQCSGRAQVTCTHTYLGIYVHRFVYVYIHILYCELHHPNSHPY